MSTTFLNAINLALEIVDESSTSINTADLTAIKSGINAGHRVIKTHIEPAAVTGSAAALTSGKISLPTDLKILYHLEHSVWGRLSYNDFEVKGSEAHILNPYITGGTITPYYLAHTTDLSLDVDVISIDDSYLNALAMMGAYYYLIKEGSFVKGQMIQGEFLDVTGLNKNYFPKIGNMEES